MIKNEFKFYRRSLLDKLLEHKYTVIFTTLFFLFLAFFYLYSADKVYRSDTTIEILPKDDIFETTTKLNPIKSNSYDRYFQTQMEFLRSRYLVEKVVEELNSNVVFYTKNKLGFFKVYKKKPFIKIENFKIKDDSFYDRFFYLKVIDDKHYSIALVKKDLLHTVGKAILKGEFGKSISTKYMNFLINKSDNFSKKGIYLRVIPKYIKAGWDVDSLDVSRNNNKSSFIQISYQNNSPYQAKLFLQTLIKVYKGLLTQNQSTQVDKYIKLVDDELKDVKVKLDKNEQLLLKFSKQNQTAGIKKQTDNTVDRIYKDEERLKLLDMKYQNLKTILTLVRDVDNYQDILTLLDGLGNNNLAVLINGILEEEKIYQKQKEKYKDLHPVMIELKRSIKTRKIALKRNLIELFKSIKRQRDELKRSIQNQKNSLDNLPSKEIGLAKLQREHQQLEKRYLALQEKRSNLNISQKIKKEDYVVNIVDKPYIPLFHIKPKGKFLVLLSIMMGLFVGVFLALLKDYFQKKVIVPADIEEIATIPLLGSIGFIKDKKLYNDLFVIKEPNSIPSNMLWQIRNSIENYKKDNEGLVVSLTSMIRGEGKTTLTANLAAALSQGDRSVIVLSLDLRLPQIHKKFHISNRFGLTTVMFDKADINNVIKKVKGFENLYFLPTGALPKTPAKVINSKFMDKLVVELKKAFDYIVIDLAPLSVAPESIFVLKKSDLNISVLKSNYSDKKFILFTEDIVNKNNIKNMVFVLNALPLKYIKSISRKENNKYFKKSGNIDLTF